MIKDAEQFKAADKDFQAKHEAKVRFHRSPRLPFQVARVPVLTFVSFLFLSFPQSDLEAYIHQVESTITGPELSLKIKRGAKAAVEAELAKALEKLEIEEST